MLAALEEDTRMNSRRDTRARKRITFEFEPNAYERLDRLKENTEATSYAELVRNALRLYEFMKEKQEEGFEARLTRESGGSKEEVVKVLF